MKASVLLFMVPYIAGFGTGTSINNEGTPCVDDKKAAEFCGPGTSINDEGTQCKVNWEQVSQRDLWKAVLAARDRDGSGDLGISDPFYVADTELSNLGLNLLPYYAKLGDNAPKCACAAFHPEVCSERCTKGCPADGSSFSNHGVEGAPDTLSCDATICEYYYGSQSEGDAETRQWCDSNCGKSGGPNTCNKCPSQPAAVGQKCTCPTGMQWCLGVCIKESAYCDED